MAKARLISVFDLSDAQADYILELQLRRLTRFSRIELETERDELQRQIEELEAILADEKLLHRTVSTELADVAKAHGTPRRTVLLESAGTPASVATPLEVTDDPCWVLLSSTGLLARTSHRRPGAQRGRPGQARRRHRRRAHHRPRRVRAGHLPRAGWCGCRRSSCRPCRRWAAPRACPGGAPLAVFVDLPARRGARSRSCRSTPDGPGSRSAPPRASSSGSPPTTRARPDWEVVALRDGDTVVGRGRAARRRRGPRLRHQRRPAAALPRLGRAAAGSRGRRDGRHPAGSPGAVVTFFGAVDPARRQRRRHLGRLLRRAARHPARRAQGDAVRRVPGQGPRHRRRSRHRFLRGEDALVLAWVGAAAGPRRPAPTASPLELPEATGKRDGSGTAYPAVIAGVGAPVR